ncbi:MAG TPA: glycoside hydrolase family 15 protein [Pyrinomonadaceae bacterium]
MFRLIILLAVISLDPTVLLAQQSGRLAPGGPGGDAHWPSARKDGFGTAHNLHSKVWFTLGEGILTEVYYPTLDTPNVQSLQLIVITPEGRVETEKDDTLHSIELADQGRSLSYRQVNKARTDEYTIYKTYVTDPVRNVLVIDVSFRAWRTDSSRYKLYVYYDPSLRNSGMHDSAWSNAGALLSSEKEISSALISKPAFVEVNTGYLSQSDFLTQLRGGKTPEHYDRATDGNVVQVGRPSSPSIVFSNWIRFSLALGFGKTHEEALKEASASLDKGFERARREYESEWYSYLAALPRVDPSYQTQFNLAAMMLTALEDKTYRGGMIASPSIPWGGGPNANAPGVSGYHAVWSRDLYQVATAFLAIGDRAAANRALDYLFKVQQKADGGIPQNSWVDGRPLGGGLQMDQVALPLVLAYQLERHDQDTWLKHVKRAADFIVTHGPTTEQERWEEEKGYSPSTIAAEIAGLICAAHTARRNGDINSATRYERVADLWAKNVNKWTATTTGKHGDGKYYLRITENENPDDGARIEINSGGGTFDEREIVDAGFLELVRLGIKPANDPLVLKSLTVVDQILMARTNAGDGWYRYNQDAYGEQNDGGPYNARTGRGRLWTFLTGERGQYELALGRKALARRRLQTMLRFANEGGMLPEQVWDRPVRAGIVSGSGTGSATPLAWSLAQFIRLAVSLQRGYNVDTPRIVADHYLRKGR